MGFFKSLATALFGESHEHQESKSKEFPYTRADAIRFTIDLIDGISETQRARLLKCFSHNPPNSQSVCDEALAILDDSDWRWREWEYWKPRCISENLWSLHLRFCNPHSDSINWDNARAKVKPETVVNSRKSQEIKDLIFKYSPDAKGIKTKADAIAFLKNNPDVFNGMRDYHIQNLWDTKPHRTHESKEEIVKLLAWTIWDRTMFVEHATNLLAHGFEYTVHSSFEQEMHFYEVALNSPDNPWKYPEIQPCFIGGCLDAFLKIS